jgi:hypothetical protein
VRHAVQRFVGRGDRGVTDGRGRRAQTTHFDVTGVVGALAKLPAIRVKERSGRGCPNTRRFRLPSLRGRKCRAIRRRYLPPGSPSCPRGLIGMTDERMPMFSRASRWWRSASSAASAEARSHTISREANRSTGANWGVVDRAGGDGRPGDKVRMGDDRFPTVQRIEDCRRSKHTERGVVSEVDGGLRSLTHLASLVFVRVELGDELRSSTTDCPLGFRPGRSGWRGRQLNNS